MKSALFLSLSVLMLAACATDPNANVGKQSVSVSPGVREEVAKSEDKSVTSNKPSSNVICRKEKPIGSNRSQTVCYTRDELAKATEAAQGMNRQRQNASVKGN